MSVGRGREFWVSLWGSSPSFIPITELLLPAPLTAGGGPRVSGSLADVPPFGGSGAFHSHWCHF